MAKIVVVGSANADMTIRSEKIPGPGETVVGGVFATAPGGKGANQAVAAARAGGDVVFVASLGADSIGDEALAGYKREGIDVSYVKRDPENATGVALILVDARGQNLISVASGANFTLSPADVDAASDAIRSADVVVAQLETPLETIEHAAKMAHDAGVPFILDPAPAPKEPLPASLLQYVSVVKPNEHEAAALVGVPVEDEESAFKAAEKLLETGVKIAVVTLGEKGVVILSQDGSRLFVEARRVLAVDATAAGDAWTGAFAVALAEGKTTKEAAEFATKAAAISVTRPGAQPSLATRSEIDAF